MRSSGQRSYKMDGFVTLLKPPGMTSNNAVYDVRRIFGIQHVGHLGTLDPGASGVLVISLGKATKLFDLLVDKEKEYRFEVTFGKSTDTQDAYGTVTATDADADVTEDMARSLIPGFLGTQEQKVPAYSALKIHGQKMYDMARNGDRMPEKTHTVTVHVLEYVRQNGRNRHQFDISCSRGTYIRQIARDMGERLGTEAYLSFLLRTRCGGFSLEDSVTIPELEQMREAGTLEKAVIPCEEALMFLDKVVLPEDRRKPSLDGLDTTWHKKDGVYRVYAGGFLGIGQIRNGRIKLTVQLADRP